ncbi:MAG: signal peptidase II [Armatimonadota bacterium]|nr:MAG: signal peptidase II [Armatimonadota bacterium]
MRASARGGRPEVLLLAAATLTFAADQLAKVAAGGALTLSTPVPLVRNWVQLRLVHNTESAFGLISSGWLLIGIGAAVCLAILAYVTVGRGLDAAPARALPLGLVLGGSLGNLLDRIRTGAVTDFMDLRVWPVFNLADIAITVGIALLAIGIARKR